MNAAFEGRTEDPIAAQLSKADASQSLPNPIAQGHQGTRAFTPILQGGEE